MLRKAARTTWSQTGMFTALGADVRKQLNVSRGLSDQRELVSTGTMTPPLFGAKPEPLGQTGGTVQPEENPRGKAAFLVEELVDQAVAGGRQLYRSPTFEEEHRLLPPSERLARILRPIVHPSACLLTVTDARRMISRDVLR